jgi:hypothetical protein
VSINEAKCFAVLKEQKFYDPREVPEKEINEKSNKLIDTMYVKFPLQLRATNN